MIKHRSVYQLISRVDLVLCLPLNLLQWWTTNWPNHLGRIWSPERSWAKHGKHWMAIKEKWGSSNKIWGLTINIWGYRVRNGILDCSHLDRFLKTFDWGIISIRFRKIPSMYRLVMAGDLVTIANCRNMYSTNPGAEALCRWYPFQFLVRSQFLKDVSFLILMLYFNSQFFNHTP